MDELFSTGQAVDWILALMAAEFVVLAALSALGITRLRLSAILFSLSAGAGLVMALREALVRAGATAIAAWLIVALAAHLGDLMLRLRKNSLHR